MRLIPRIAVVPTNNRPCLDRCLHELKLQADQVYVIQNGDGPERPCHDNVQVVWTDVKNNISTWWNLGLELADNYARELDAKAWDVAVINDDVILPEGWYDRVSGIMRQMQVAAACSGGRGPQAHLHVTPGPVDLFTRMQGFAFMLAGEKGLRADETLAWWAGDDDLDWKARQQGGMVMVPGYHVEHLYPNGQMNPERHAQAGRDMQTFLDKWGMRPW